MLAPPMEVAFLSPQVHRPASRCSQLAREQNQSGNMRFIIQIFLKASITEIAISSLLLNALSACDVVYWLTDAPDPVSVRNVAGPTARLYANKFTRRRVGCKADFRPLSSVIMLTVPVDSPSRVAGTPHAGDVGRRDRRDSRQRDVGAGVCPDTPTLPDLMA